MQSRPQVRPGQEARGWRRQGERGAGHASTFDSVSGIVAALGAVDAGGPAFAALSS